MLLRAPTPESWVDLAAERWKDLLLDHANCEKKAASQALALMFAYGEDRHLATRLSRLAREELRHYEQVLKVMERLGVAVVRQSPGRYGAGLRALTAREEPARKLDLLLSGALIEARSSERFRLLRSRLPPLLAEFYAGLEAAEARHEGLYLDLARREAQADPGLDFEARLARLAEREAELATSPDPQFRFHSGAPAGA